MNSNNLNSKKVLWIATLVQNVFVSIEALVFSILTFSIWFEIGGFSTMHCLWFVFTLTYIFNAVIGFCMKDKTGFILAYAIINGISRFLFFFFLFASFYLLSFAIFIDQVLSPYSKLYILLLYIYLNNYISVVYFWFWIQIPLMIEGTILVIYYRVLVKRDQSNNVMVNINAVSPLYHNTIVAPPQYFQPGTAYQNPQVYNPPSQPVYYANPQLVNHDKSPQPEPNPSSEIV